MKCPKCGRELREVNGVTYDGKHAYSCIVCGYKGWLYKQVSYERENSYDRRAETKVH